MKRLLLILMVCGLIGAQSFAADVAAINRIPIANIASINGISKTNIASVNGLRIASGGGTIDDPTDVPNLWAWYKSDVGVMEADGTAAEDADDVMTWEDQSGNGRHLTQATAGERPRFNTGIKGGFGAITFGSSDSMVYSFAPTSQPFTIIVSARVSSSSGTFQALIDGDASTHRLVLYKDNSEKFVIFAGSSQTLASPPLAGSGWYFFTGVFDGASSKRALNNTIVTGLNAGANQWGGLRVGSLHDKTGNWTGYIGEVLIYNRALSDAEITNLLNYLNGASRWNGVF